MHEPANMPVEVMCHDLAMKHESMVYQFHSIEILQVGLPPMFIVDAVDEAAAEVVVAVMPAMFIVVEVPPMSIVVEVPLMSIVNDVLLMLEVVSSDRCNRH